MNRFLHQLYQLIAHVMFFSLSFYRCWSAVSNPAYNPGISLPRKRKKNIFFDKFPSRHRRHKWFFLPELATWILLKSILFFKLFLILSQSSKYFRGFSRPKRQKSS